MLGQGFRFDATETVRSELLIFLTPRIVKTQADAELIKQIEAERMHYIESEAEEIHGPLFSVPGQGVSNPEYRNLQPANEGLLQDYPSAGALPTDQPANAIQPMSGTSSKSESPKRRSSAVRRPGEFFKRLRDRGEK